MRSLYPHLHVPSSDQYRSENVNYVTFVPARHQNSTFRIPSYGLFWINSRHQENPLYSAIAVFQSRFDARNRHTDQTEPDNIAAVKLHWREHGRLPAQIMPGSAHRSDYTTVTNKWIHFLNAGKEKGSNPAECSHPATISWPHGTFE